MSKTKYIAYGSNLNLSQMSSRCPDAIMIGTSELNDYRLVFRGGEGRAVATIEPEKGYSVPVLVWEIEPSDEASLDRYEGFPYLYRKEMLTVDLNSESVEAMVYIMNDGRTIGLPSAYYYGTIRQGYIDCGFDEKYLKDAFRQAAKEDRAFQKFPERPLV